MFKASFLPVLLFLALIFTSCSKNCEECANDFSVRFRFENVDGDEVLDDLSQLNIITLNGEELVIEREETETDSIFLTNMDLDISTSEASDTIIFFYNNAIVDSAAVTYGFQRDSDCCTNPRQVEGLNTFNYQSIRLIRREFDVYSIVLE